MNKARTIGTVAVMGILVAGASVLLMETAFGHCDSMNGPVIPEARAALENGDVSPIIKWVQVENEAEIKAAFAKAVAVRAMNPGAKELADQWFLETLVRLHRAGEGAPYTGIKDEPVEPIVAMADKALVDSSSDEMIKRISGHMEEAIGERLRKVVEARKNKDQSVAAGREYVEAYVTYIHFVEGIHTAIVSTGAHHGEGEDGIGGHQD